MKQLVVAGIDAVESQAQPHHVELPLVKDGGMSPVLFMIRCTSAARNSRNMMFLLSMQGV